MARKFSRSQDGEMRMTFNVQFRASAEDVLFAIMSHIDGNDLVNDEIGTNDILKDLETMYIVDAGASLQNYCDDVDFDDPETTALQARAVGLFVRMFPEVPVPNSWMEAVEDNAMHAQIFPSVAGGPSPADDEPEQSIARPNEHDWEKKNLVTIDSPSGLYDLWQCRRCKKKYKRYGLSGFPEEVCPKA